MSALSGRIRVLHVTQSAVAGVATSLLLLLRHLDTRRFESHLACPAGSPLGTAARALGVRVVDVDLVRNPHPVRDVRALGQLVRLMRRDRYALVHVHSAKAGYLGRLAAHLAGTSKTVYSPQAFSYLSQRGPVRAFFAGLERIAVPMTDALIASSGSEWRRAVQDLGFPPSRAVVIPNAVDLTDAAAIGANGGAGGPVVLTVSRIAYQKNPEMFVGVAQRVLRQRPRTRFVFNGGGLSSPLEGRFRALVAGSGLDARFQIVPWGERSATLRLLSQCSVFVLNSRFEGLPYSLLEAMMLARPAVVTDVDGSRDVVQNGVTGYVVPPADEALMAERIISLLDDPARAQEMGARGREAVVRNHDIRTTIGQLEELYHGLLSASAVAARRPEPAGIGVGPENSSWSA